MAEEDSLDIDRAFAEKVAQTIGGEVTADRVMNFIKQANEKGLLFHGIKSRKKAESAFAQGILPLTPEGGNVSFWAVGQHVFAHPVSLDKGMFGYDSPFFHYAQWSDSDISGLTIAVTSTDRLNQGEFRPLNTPAQTTVVTPINPSNIQFIYIEGAETPNQGDKTVRNIRQRVVQRGFELLEEVANNGPQFGTVVRATL